VPDFATQVVNRGADQQKVSMSNPFENADARFYAVINDEGQYSLWPASVDVPQGWTSVFGEDSRVACLDFIEQNWTDMRPKSLRMAMEGR
jgi:MbtH protein